MMAEAGIDELRMLKLWWPMEDTQCIGKILKRRSVQEGGRGFQESLV